MSVKASSDVKCLALGRDVLNRILGDKVEVIIYKNIAKWSLERLEGFHGLSKVQKEKLLNVFKINHHREGDVILPKFTPLRNAIIIVLEGQVTK